VEGCASRWVPWLGMQLLFDLLDLNAATVSPAPPAADKSGTLDFGEWVEWWLQKQRGYAWQDGGKPPSS